MDIQFINCKEWGVKPKSFEVYTERLKKHVPDTEGVLNVVFVNDPYIQALNRQYRKKNQPTDVLSFSYINTPDFQKTRLIGEIYISVPTAKRQASEYHHTLQDELNKLLVHGLLHIFGHDHENEKGYKEMSELEEKILGTR